MFALCYSRGDPRYQVIQVGERGPVKSIQEVANSVNILVSLKCLKYVYEWPEETGLRVDVHPSSSPRRVQGLG